MSARLPLALALLVSLTVPVAAETLLYDLTALETDFRWLESCDFVGCTLSAGGALTSTVELPPDVVSVQSAQLLVFAESIPGTHHVICEPVRCDPTRHLAWFEAEVIASCGHRWSIRKQPEAPGPWFVVPDLADGDGCADLDALAAGPITLGGRNESVRSDQGQYWAPDPITRVSAFELRLEVERAVPTTPRSFGAVKALY